ncbi:hypothetical protein J1N35_003056 [Gossypium stocksii]|uniref:Uncharacterized protein n=1 Tax=Gossypium stocksii TaxID=47602 RepID=A0A9D3WNC6_9ROSI|nr:hypothetical protein J1N35_003056 [Gossypium stocksii]
MKKYVIIITQVCVFRHLLLWMRDYTLCEKLNTKCSLNVCLVRWKSGGIREREKGKKIFFECLVGKKSERKENKRVVIFHPNVLKLNLLNWNVEIKENGREVYAGSN